MTFTDALSVIFNDNDRVTRTVWHNRAAVCALEDGLLCTTWDSKAEKVDHLWHPWTISEQDYFADDWEVVVDG